jgi:hypothetical protein
MKHNLRNLILLASLALTHAMGWGAPYIIGLSPHYTPPDREVVLKQLLLFALEGASPGDELTVYDALHQQPVTRIVAPSGALFAHNPRARVQHLKGEIAALQRFLSASASPSPEMAGVIDAPTFLALAGAQLRQPGEPARILLLASPFYMDPENPSWNMNEAYPSDGCVAASQQDSVFGTANQPRALAGVEVHYGYLRECFVNDVHRERLKRFWSLFVHSQQGVLVTFAPDLGLAFQRAAQHVQAPCLEAQLDAGDAKIEMRRVLPRAIPVWLGQTNPVPEVASAPLPAPSLPVQPVEVPVPAPAPNQPPQASPSVTNQAVAAAFPVNPLPDKVGIGIMWSASGVDCDLYVKPSPSAKELYYRNTSSKEGRYSFDYRNRNDQLDYEYVELKAPVDLRQVSAWVNYYAGHAAQVRGQVVVFYQGQRYMSEFALGASRGNEGGESRNRPKSPHWVQLDLSKIVGLSAPVAAASPQ